MKKYLISILTHNSLELLNLSIYSAINQNFKDYDIHIIVNSTNTNYYNKVVELCNNKYKNNIIKIIKTESNGKPGKGHNSVINEFKKTNYTYLLTLDGDDFLYPSCLERLDNIITKDIDIIQYINSSLIKIKNINKKININEFNYNYSFEIEKLQNINNLNTDYNTTLATPFRLLLISNSMAKKIDNLFDENMNIYDDFIMYYKIYNMYLKNNNNIIYLCDSNLYLYNNINILSVSKKENKDNDYNIYKTYNIKNLDVSKIKITNNNNVSNIMKNNIFENYILDNISKIFILNTDIKYNNYSNYTIKFIDNGTEWNYNTINERSLRGTENAIYQLANMLRKNNNVSVYTKNGIKIIHNNVNYNNINHFKNNDNNEIFIIQGTIPFNLDNIINKKIFMWIQHDITVECIKKSYSNLQNFDKYIYKYIFVSNWQKNRYIQYYKLNPDKCFVIQNGISPSLKYNPNIKKELTLIYSSSPYRGMINLIPFINSLKNIFPNIKLKVFSSFKIENKNNKPLTLEELNKLCIDSCDKYYYEYYKLMINHPNIKYYANVPQKILFKHFNSAMILFYPNTFPETCCTTILEAMAMRCNIVSSDLGALRETSNNMAYLYDPCIDVNNHNIKLDDFILYPKIINDLSSTYKKNVLNKLIYILKNYNSPSNKLHLDKQQEYVFNKCTWENRMYSFYNIL